MNSPIITTKLHIPKLSSRIVLRPRLLERLNEGLDRKITLISAPAGFGKTTLVSEWVSASDRASAWLSLDSGISDPTRLLTYLVAALQTISADLANDILTILQSPQPPSTESVLTILLNEIAAFQQRFILVLDDLHVIDDAIAEQTLTFMIDHLPPQIHLVIITREDPELPLARLRAQGQMTELWANDLRFTPDEAADFLNRVMGLELSAEIISKLETRTEGWITGLQLAAVAMQGTSAMHSHGDVETFIQSFTGSHRFVLDYLVEEVLAQQTEAVRTFLLCTSILTRLSGDLCDAVLPDSQIPGQDVLEYLEKANLLIVPLDDTREWYRYHHLFADALKTLLRKERGDQVRELHLRSSRWHEVHDLPADAIRHAFEAEDSDRAASLLQWAWPKIRQAYHETTLLGWLNTLPDDLLVTRPVLSMYYAIALLPFDPDAAETYMQNVEHWLQNNPDYKVLPDVNQAAEDRAHRSVVTGDEYQSLPGLLAFSRAYQSATLRNTVNTMSYAERALDVLPDRDYLYRSSAAVLLGLAHWAIGDLGAAYEAINGSMTDMQKAENVSGVIGIRYLLADIELARGHLRGANSMLQFALNLSKNHRKRVPQGTADVYVLLSELHYERNELESARDCLTRAHDLGEHAALQEQRHRWYVAMARLEASGGHYDRALQLLDEAAQIHVTSPTPDVRPVGALKARIWVRQGRLAEAHAWARERGLSVDDEPSYLREFEHLTLARIIIAQYRLDPTSHSLDPVNTFLARLLHAAEVSDRIASTTEILILQAIVQQLQDNDNGMLLSFERALSLAEPEGYVRIFIDEGEPMAHLLQKAVSTQTIPGYAQSLLASMAGSNTVRKAQTIDHSALVDPLSEREIEILEHIAQGLTNQEIADRFYLSLYTVKAHARNIYSKLSVSNRTQAVNRARSLGILPPT